MYRILNKPTPQQDGSSILHFDGIARTTSEDYLYPYPQDVVVFRNMVAGQMTVTIGNTSTVVNGGEYAVFFNVTQFSVITPETTSNQFFMVDSSSSTPSPTIGIKSIQQEVPIEGIEKIQSLSQFHIFAGIDSLTAGAGGSSYLNFLEPVLRSQIGDGGPGLHMLDFGKSVENGGSLGKSANVKYMVEQAFTDAPAKYSICKLGLYTDAGSGTDTIDYTPKRKYTNARIFYLQQPSGGTFKVGNTPVNSSTYPTIDTNGTLDLKYIDIDATNFTSAGLAFRNITGKVAIFGIFFTNGIAGVTVSRLAIGGTKMSEHASLDSSFRQKWFNIIQPQLYILNGGMNDRGTSNANSFKSSVTTFVNDIKSGSSNTQVLLVMPNESNDYKNTFLSSYQGVLETVSRANFYGFTSNREFMGTYFEADSRGLMLDTIHPNERGNRLIATKIAEYLGYSGSAKNVDADQFAGSSGSVAIKRTALTVKTPATITSGNTYTAYKLGLINGFPNGVLTLLISGSRAGTAYATRKRTDMIISNGTTLNAITGFNGLTSVVEFTYNGGGANPVVDFTVTAAIVGNWLEVYVSPNTTGSNMDFYIEGYITLTYNNTTGKSVFEN